MKLIDTTGKYVILVSGNVGSVKNAVETGIRVADSFLVKRHIITNLDERVIGALSSTNKIKEIKSIGLIETKSALASIKAADISVMSSPHKDLINKLFKKKLLK